MQNAIQRFIASNSTNKQKRVFKIMHYSLFSCRMRQKRDQGVYNVNCNMCKNTKKAHIYTNVYPVKIMLYRIQTQLTSTLNIDPPSFKLVIQQTK